MMFFGELFYLNLLFAVLVEYRIALCFVHDAANNATSCGFISETTS